MSNVIEGIITDVMKAEGWDRYTNRPNDRGGPTKWGITLATYRDHEDDDSLTDADIRALTEADARAFYRERYFDETAFDRLHFLLLPFIVDCAVNHGRKRASKWFQKAVGAKEDGVIGPNTLAAAEAVSPTVIYLSICAYRVRFYGAIVGRDHSQVEHISGWNNRAAKFIVALADLLKEG